MFIKGDRVLYRGKGSDRKYTQVIILSINGHKYTICGVGSKKSTIEIGEWFFHRENIEYVRYDDLTEREKFIYEMSGKMPERLL